MTASAFSKYAFSRALKAGDSSRFGIELKTDKEAAIAAAIACSRSPSEMSDYNEFSGAAKPCVSYSQYPITLVLRALANNLRYRSKVSMPDRNQIVAGVMQAVSEATPMAIHRRDISSFYECVPLKGLRARLLNTALLSPRAREVLERFFEVHCGSNLVGVPRGLSVSAVLAEMAMQAFDEQIRRHPGVYRYYRFSDDMLIFAHDLKLDIDKVLAGILDPCLPLNPKKKQSIVLNGADSHQKKYKSFEYLGYDFHLSNRKLKKREARPFSVCIAASKVRKMKTRVIMSLKHFQKQNDTSLLIDRLHFIAGNYDVARSRINVKAPKRKVRSGVFFNYRHCRDAAALESLPSNRERLQNLDNFLHGLLWGKNSQFSTIVRAMATSEQNSVKRLRFQSGFDRRMMYHFRPARIREIKKAWANVR